MATTRRKRTPSEASGFGDVVVIRKDCPCGWCITGQCEECRGELLSDKKLYLCGCKKCCDGHVPSIGEEVEVEEVDEGNSDGEV